MAGHKYVVEFIGAFFLVLTIGMVSIEPVAAGGLAPLAIGSVLMVMVYAGGHISGAHYNPAVTLAVWMRGKMPSADVAPYMLAQVLGAVAAAFTVNFLKAGAPVTASEVGPFPAVLSELLFTFALCWVVLNVATARETAGNAYFGLAIGFTVLVGAFAVGGVSGGAFNPAVAVGISLMGLASWSNIWIFLVGNFAGAALAALAFRGLSVVDAEPEAIPVPARRV